MEETFEQENEFKIDSISLEDWKLYKELWLDALTSDPQAFAYSLEKVSNRTREDWKEDMERSFQSNTGMYIAKTNDKYIGMMGYYPKGENNVNIFGVYVKRKFRGQGVSDKIMESILNSLSDNDEIKSASLTVNDEQTEAIDFYKRFGFEIVGETKNVKMGNGKPYNMLSMKKEIK